MSFATEFTIPTGKLTPYSPLTMNGSTVHQALAKVTMLTVTKGAYVKSLNKWWDGYSGEDVVIIDDFGPNQECLMNY